MTKLLFVVHDDVADAVPACKDAGGGGKAWGYFSQVCWCVQRIGLQDAVLNIFKKSELTGTKLKAKQQQMGTAAQSKLI